MIWSRLDEGVGFQNVAGIGAGLGRDLSRVVVGPSGPPDGQRAQGRLDPQAAGRLERTRPARPNFPRVAGELPRARRRPRRRPRGGGGPELRRSAILSCLWKTRRAIGRETAQGCRLFREFTLVYCLGACGQAGAAERDRAVATGERRSWVERLGASHDAVVFPVQRLRANSK